jgi:riboflavin biosynthesis pyrimidine reductase
MRNRTSKLLARHHATMVSMTTLRKDWPQRQFRLDNETMQTVRVKLATDGEKWQSVMETLARGWLAGVIDVNEIRRQLEDRAAE